MAQSGLGDPLFLLYVGVFSIAGLVCLLSLRGLARVEDPDSRRGLGALLVLTGGWAFAHVAYLVAPNPTLQYTTFLAGLVIGIAAVGPWLYFCSAYTGRSLHRNRTIQWGAIGTFLGITLVKLTNPIHGQYFSAEVVSEPFSHLAIHHEPLHWVVMGLAYALAIVGIFMLFELFIEVSYDTRPLFIVVGLTGLPVVFDFVGAVTPYLLDVTHSPLGVAAFAVGMLYVYVEQFQTVQLTGDTDTPTLLLDQDDRLFDWNQAAEIAFPAVKDAMRKPLNAVEPALADALDGPNQLVSVEQSDTTRYYRVSTNPFSTDSTRLGMMITLTDVSEREQYRQRLERQKKRLEEFANIVSHDLRNPLNVAQGRLELALETGDLEQLTAVEDAHQRMRELIEDLLSLAQSGLEIDETESVALDTLARECWTMIDSAEASLVIGFDDSPTIRTDRERLRQLFENLYRNAIEHGGHDVTIRTGSLTDEAGFFVEDDGVGIPDEHREELFEPGFTTRERGTGFGLAIVGEIASAHDWDITVKDSSTGGARFEISGIEYSR